MDIVATIKHVRSKTVSQGMGRKRFCCKPRFVHGAVYYHLHTAYMHGSFGLLTGK